MTQDQALAFSAAFLRRFDAHRAHAIEHALKRCPSKGGMFIARETIAQIVAAGFNSGLLALAGDSLRLDYLGEGEAKRTGANGTDEAPFRVTALDGKVCWAKHFREAIDAAMQHDQEQAALDSAPPPEGDAKP